MEYKCKGREKEYKKEWYLKNKDKRREYQKQYRLKNKDKIKEKHKQYQDRDWLYQKYVVEELNPHKIAMVCKCNHKTIRVWLKLLNIHIRSISEATKIEMKNPKVKKKLSIASKKMWEKPGFREEHRKVMLGVIPWNKGLNGKKYRMYFKNGFSGGTKNPWNKGKRFPQVTGINNWKWKGGISKLITKIRRYQQYTNWRQKVFERDNYTCQKCGYDKGHVLEAHHVKSIYKIFQYHEITTIQEAFDCKELWDINNGITLCKKCHRLIHSKKGAKLNKSLKIMVS